MYNTFNQKRNRNISGILFEEVPLHYSKIKNVNFEYINIGRTLTETHNFSIISALSYRHAGAALGEVDNSRVELVFQEVSMCHNSPSQRQTGGSHQGRSHHVALSGRYCGGETGEVAAACESWQIKQSNMQMN